MTQDHLKTAKLVAENKLLRALLDKSVREIHPTGTPTFDEWMASVVGIISPADLARKAYESGLAAGLTAAEIQKLPALQDPQKDSNLVRALNDLTPNQRLVALQFPVCMMEEGIGYLTSGADVKVIRQDEVPEAPEFAIQVVGTEFWIDCEDTEQNAIEKAENLGLNVT